MMAASKEILVTSRSDRAPRKLSMVLGCFILILLPYIHIGIIHLKIWVPDKPAVDKKNCNCSCFDTVFKGSYEKQNGRQIYKHIYFNATSNTFTIWSITAIFMVLCYESVKSLVKIFRRSRARLVWLGLFLVNIYPHYYSWWSFFSYLNDDFYDYYYHHMVYTLTELVSSGLVLTLCDVSNEIVAWKLMTIFAINTVHTVGAGLDNFIYNVIQGEGKNHQTSRDMGLMIPDVCHLIVSAHFLVKIIKQRKADRQLLITRKESRVLAVLIVVSTIACLFLRFI